jgi:hypothetical protein
MIFHLWVIFDNFMDCFDSHIALSYGAAVLIINYRTKARRIAAVFSSLLYSSSAIRMQCTPKQDCCQYLRVRNSKRIYKPQGKLVITTRQGNLLGADSYLNGKKNGLEERTIQTRGYIVVFPVSYREIFNL